MNNNLATRFSALALSFSATLLGLCMPAQADLLQLPIGTPQVVTDSGGACGYDAGTGVLTLTGAPTYIYFDAEQSNVSFVDLGMVTISANIDNSGSLVGGTFTLDGETTDWNTSDYFASPLLTGTIVAYGIAAPGTSDLVDFRIQPTGGSLLARYAPGDQIGVQVSLEGSTFNGSFASNWNCARDKFIIGPTPPPVQETCDLALTKSANPTTIGPIYTPPGHDKHDDDDDDENERGYSHDDDDPSIYCGCRGKVTELTLRYTGTQAANVIVTRKPPFSVVLYQGLVQPGAEFTVMGNYYGPKGFKDTLGTAIEIAVDGGEAVELHTSCSEPIGPGLVVGDFEVVSGKSRKLRKPLCPIDNGGCPANQQVTYTYTLINNGSALVNVTLDDDKLGNILTGGTLAAGETQTYTKSACLSETTTNVATAMGELPSGAHCAAAPASATVTLTMPPQDCATDPKYCEHDDEDDQPPVGGGCSHDYWKGHKHKWGKSFKHGDKFGAIFQVDSAGNRSLLDNLELKGDGAKALSREAVTALLNASNSNVHYAYTPAEVKAIVKNAFETKDYQTATKLLKKHNDCGCPLQD